MKGNYQNIERFSNYLNTLKDWDSYVIDLFIAGKEMNRLKGKHATFFISRTSSAVNMLNLLIQSNEIGNFFNFLKGLEKMIRIISFFLIDDYGCVKLASNETFDKNSPKTNYCSCK